MLNQKNTIQLVQMKLILMLMEMSGITRQRKTLIQKLNLKTINLNSCLLKQNPNLLKLRPNLFLIQMFFGAY